MDHDRWLRVSSLFAAALERDPAERGALLDAASDPDLRREVASLLVAHDSVGPLDRLAAAPLGGLGSHTRTHSPPSSGGVTERGPGLEPGQRLGRHEIRGRLGEGGMGEVYRAFDTRLQREVAIKVLGRRVQQRPEALQRFEQEARAASALNHPHIITVHDIGEEASFPFIVMELVEGESLRQMLARPCPVELLLQLSVQIADGLVAAHERQIVHRDLKPENILVSRQGIAKILDFGLAQIQLEGDEILPDGPSAESPRAPGGFVGTPGYISPEVLAGEPVDQRADQFALGAILYEMATGTCAFPGRTSLERLTRTLSAGPRPLAEVRPDLPPSFARAVTRCLHKAPDERYPITRELLDELRAARRGAATARPRPPLALPAARTRLIGRRRELEEIERLLAEKEVRLLTLTGAGGTGKTRLALKAAEVLSPRFPGGVFFVPLAPITDASLLAPAIAQATASVATAGRPVLAAIMADLRSANAPALLLLDNFEQVIDAAPVVSELLAACPDLSAMVTSREVLRLYGEHGFPVLPLELPDPAQLPPLETLAECPAVALFVERAQAANASFRLSAENAAPVAELCARLDGLPLALELAAAHTRVLPPEALLSRLDCRLGLLTGGARDLPGRQQTLRRTIDWSHQLLDGVEQAVFRRLAAFAGSFTLEAAQAVADPYGSLGLPLENGVSALADKSLLQAREPTDGEARFVMLETLREYALEKLDRSGEAEQTRQAHAAYFLVLAEEGTTALASSEQPRWLKRFETEHDNFRAALEWLTRSGNAEWGLRLGLALFPFWERGEHLGEGRRRLGALLDLEAPEALSGQRAKALFAAGVLAHIQGDADEGSVLHGESLAIYRRLGDRCGIAVALVALGTQYTDQGEYERARRVLEESFEIWQELGDDTGFARSVSNLAFVARAQGRLEESRALYQRAASMFERLGDPLSRAWALDHEGDVAREQGRMDAAQSLYEEALVTFRSLDDGWGIGCAVADLGAIARQRGDYAGARRLYCEALTSFVELDHRRGIARLFESLACLAAEEGQAERGLALAAAAAVLRERVGAPPSLAARAELEHCLSALQDRLGAEAARCVWRAGAAMSVGEAVELATAGGEPA